MQRCVFSCLVAALLIAAASAETSVVNPQGTGDFPTIQAALDSVVSGDVIELTNGVFRGDGNRDVSILDEAAPLVEDCIFVENSAYHGGAISSCWASYGNAPDIVRCTFLFNTASRPSRWPSRPPCRAISSAFPGRIRSRPPSPSAPAWPDSRSTPRRLWRPMTAMDSNDYAAMG